MLRRFFARPAPLRVRLVGLSVLTALMAPLLSVAPAQAKTPGKTYCFNGTCHRVKSLTETALLVGHDETHSTSFYDDCKHDRFNPCGLTSSGEVFHADTPDNAASPIYPDGTVLLIRNPGNNKSAVVRVNNAGPYYGKRTLDVSRATAEALGFKKSGVAKLQTRVVSAPTETQARYKRNRRYDTVPGVIGTFASLDAAQGGMMLAMALDAMPGSVLASAGAKFAALLKTANPKLARLMKSSKVASADAIEASPALSEGESPADGLRAAARKTYGGDRGHRRSAPVTLTAQAMYARIIARL